MLIVGGLLLALADGARGKRTIDEVSLRDALAMGVGQAIAAAAGRVALGRHDHRRPLRGPRAATAPPGSPS